MNKQELYYCTNLDNILTFIKDNYHIMKEEEEEGENELIESTLESYLTQYTNFYDYVESNIECFSDQFIEYFNNCLDRYRNIIDIIN